MQEHGTQRAEAEQGQGRRGTSVQQALGGLLVRKERWTLSFRGWLLVSLIVFAAAFTISRGLYSFLAVTSRTSGEILVVEGWIHSDSVEQAATEYKAANYQNVIVVAAVHKVGNKWDSGRYRPEYIADNLVRLGVPGERVHVVFCEVVRKDRTYESARAARRWIHEQGMPIKSIDVVTIGSHARRSRLLFQKVFGSDVKVGVLAMDDREFDPAHWWRSSEGVREVLFEGVAYIYAKFFFLP
jgi:uncharacterized SAM-binding protein YcdF (DUF218 family)